ncbi:hypothetical protein CP532_3239 [Ophiocordyceps camponoti-leonardi (nom. inval.)]|nr:hypothetical protein CP532_3239 [Ophiocordyceps camponoti-leonardi (nom. inval.)]
MTQQEEPDSATKPPTEETSPETKSQNPSAETTSAPLSKNALKRIRRQEEWEAGREERRKRRREKRIDRRLRRREEQKRVGVVVAGGDKNDDDDVADPVAGTDHHAEKQVTMPSTAERKKKQPQKTMPVAIVVDCDFESYMTDKEHISLASQLTRCYSANRQATCRAHLCMAGWRGKLRDRFRDVLGDQHRHWKGVAFVEGDYLVCADEARRRMTEHPPASPLDDGPLLQSGGSSAWVKDDDDDDDASAPPLDEAHADVVYLTSESPYTLQRLEPNTVYVVGGLVDRNREKGLCYRRARERGIRTARLPITQFMRMQSRRVLATNHVVEILLKWLECGDWGDAFLAVIPKRKGGSLIRDDDGQSSVRDEDDGHDEDCKKENLEEIKEENRG